MKLFSGLPIALLLLLGLTAVSFAQDKTVDPKDVAELKKIYREFDAAGKNRDIKTVEKYLDSGYEMQNGNTTLTRAEVIKSVREFFAAIEEVAESASTIEKVEVADGNYFLQVTAVLKGKLRLADGKIVAFESTGKSTDIWMKTDNGWKENTQIVRSSKLVVDGKVVPL
jgi:ketosteroid isomerase-like protein